MGFTVGSCGRCGRPGFSDSIPFAKRVRLEKEGKLQILCTECSDHVAEVKESLTAPLRKKKTQKQIWEEWREVLQWVQDQQENDASSPHAQAGTYSPPTSSNPHSTVQATNPARPGQRFEIVDEELQALAKHHFNAYWSLAYWNHVAVVSARDSDTLAYHAARLDLIRALIGDDKVQECIKDADKKWDALFKEFEAAVEHARRDRSPCKECGRGFDFMKGEPFEGQRCQDCWQRYTALERGRESSTDGLLPVVRNNQIVYVSADGSLIEIPVDHDKTSKFGDFPLPHADRVRVVFGDPDRTQMLFVKAYSSNGIFWGRFLLVRNGERAIEVREDPRDFQEERAWGLWQLCVPKDSPSQRD